MDKYVNGVLYACSSRLLLTLTSSPLFTSLTKEDVCLYAFCLIVCLSSGLCACLSFSLSSFFFSRSLTVNFPQDALDVALIEEAPEGLHSSKCTTGTRLGLRVSRRPFPWPSTILHLDGRASWTQKSFPQTGLVC